MKEVDGRLVYDSTDELVAPSRAALLIIDVQNDFCAPEGAFDRNGYDVSLYEGMLGRLGRLLETARQANVLVIFVQNTSLPGARSDSPAWIRFRMRLSRDPLDAALQYTVAGTWGHEIVEVLRPELDEIAIQKFRSSAFAGTPLDLLLRSNGIETIVVTGATTEGCVESTARDGMFLDYYVVVVPDCVESDSRELHKASVTLMRSRFDMIDSSEIEAAWESGKMARSTGEVGEGDW